jgi:hypothetical protein
VAAYKSLSHVERAFRSIKTVDLHVRPVFHYNVGADLKLTQPTDLSLTRGWVPAL